MKESAGVRDRQPVGRLVPSRDVGGRALEDRLLHHLPRLHAFVRHQLGPTLANDESVADVVHSVALTLLERIDRVDDRGDGALMGWLQSAARNELRQLARRQRALKRNAGRTPESLDEGSLPAAQAPWSSPTRHAIRREQLRRLEQALERLPERYRLVVTLSKFQGLSQAQVARRMGRTVPSVRNLLHRALASLARELSA